MAAPSAVRSNLTLKEDTEFESLQRLEVMIKTHWEIPTNLASMDTWTRRAQLRRARAQCRLAFSTEDHALGAAVLGLQRSPTNVELAAGRARQGQSVALAKRCEA
jgi:hypothetical protein